MYSPEGSYTVYCRDCWWSDRWDPLTYGRDIDFSQPFFDQFDELLKVVPRIALMMRSTENSDYCNEVDDLKDSYMAVCSFFSERLLYTYWFGWGHDCVDSSYTLWSDLCYECQDAQKSYCCQYVYNSTQMTDSLFCFNCNDCVSCFMCVNLNHKSYCIQNKQYTKEEYAKRLSEFNFGSATAIKKLKSEFWKFARQFPRRFAFIKNSEDCAGDYMTNCKNVYHGFDAFGQENSSYIYDAGDAKECMDITQAGIKCELMYEVHSNQGLYNVHFVNWTWGENNSEYLDSCHNNQNLFGCIGLRKKQYCILNKQYSPAEYAVMRDKLIEHMKRHGEYGEFFPVHLSPYAYNQTVAQQWYSKTKQEVEANGWRWEDKLPGKFGPGTLAWKQVPDTIQEAPESITNEILSCTNCTKNYRVVKPEFAFYKKQVVPIPRLCPDCRFYERIALRNPRRLWHRQCVCSLGGHDHAGQCKNEFETTYAPERPEKVFCEGCYQKEVI